MLLTKHEGVKFQNQTIYISGQAFINCTFTDCTLVLGKRYTTSRIAHSTAATGTSTGS